MQFNFSCWIILNGALCLLSAAGKNKPVSSNPSVPALLMDVGN
jgi:hypothetical protein